MKKVYLIHGFEGSPNGGWRPYIMRELGKYGIYACSLPMPSPEKPILYEWLLEIKRVIDRDKNDEIYLVGHSLGGTIILRYLEKFNNKNVKGIVSVSAPCIRTETNGHVWNFLESEFDWNLIKSRINKSVVIQGDDDPYVPMTNADMISKELGSKLIIIKNGKHLNNSAGFVELPELLEVLLEMIK